MEQVPITVYSSLLFFVNYLHAFYNEYNIYALLFLGLTISSVLHHSYYIREKEKEEKEKEELSIPMYNKTIKIIDKILCYLIIFYGGYMLTTKMQSLLEVTPEKKGLILIILSTFFATIFLFCSPNKYSFSIVPEEALLWHAFLHFIASVGHHCIIFL
jgi:hypothetical protein